jgi:putative YjhG/YagF family dehydratase
MAVRSAKALWNLAARKETVADLLSDDSVYNAMVVHAAMGGSTNLLLHLPAIAFSAGLDRPTVEQWSEVNRAVARFVDVLPNGPKNHPTVQVFLAGGVPEVMLHLRERGLLRLNAKSVSGRSIGDVLEWWETSDRRSNLRRQLAEKDGINPDDVIIPPDEARRRGMTSTVCFPIGNLCPEGSVIKATSIDPSVVDDDGVYRKVGPAKVFTREKDAIAAVKGQADRKVEAGDVLVLMGRGPIGSGMEETYQITSALKYLPWGKEVAVITDARFSGVSTGACIGHVGPEALAGGPISKIRDGDRIEITIDRNKLSGSINLVGDGDRDLSPSEAAQLLNERQPHPDLGPDADLPPETRLWAAMQQMGGGTWGGCVYDVDKIVSKLQSRKE